MISAAFNKGGFFVKKKSEISRMFAYAGNRHWLTILGMILAGLSTVLFMFPLPALYSPACPDRRRTKT